MGAGIDDGHSQPRRAFYVSVLNEEAQSNEESIKGSDILLGIKPKDTALDHCIFASDRQIDTSTDS